MMDVEELFELMYIVDRQRLCVKEIEDDTMKLFLCTECQDVVRCIDTPRECRCGKSSGHYTDKINAVFSGKHCVPIGMGWSGLAKAIKMAQVENKHQTEPTTCKGVDFKSFVILDCATSITKE